MARKKSSGADKRKDRARELRAEIDRLTGKSPPAPGASTKPESPAAFVHRRMAELDEKKKDQQSGETV